MKHKVHNKLAQALPTLLLLWGTVFILHNSRNVLGPLREDIAISLGANVYEVIRSVQYFAFGNIMSLLLSGYVAYFILHTRTLMLSLLLMVLGLLGAASSQTIDILHISFLVFGIGAGLYPGSGITVANSMSSERIKGTVIAIHETSPVGAFILAPLFASLGLLVANWRYVMIFLACIAFILLLFVFFGCKEGYYKGKPLNFKTMLVISREPVFWILGLSFALAASINGMVYIAIAEYLHTSHGMLKGAVNIIVSLSRISGLIIIFFVGGIIRRFSSINFMGIMGIGGGILTILLGFTNSSLLILMVFLQAFILSGFFPAGLVAIGTYLKGEYQNLAISLSILLANLLGIVFPMLYEMFGKWGRLDWFFVLLGTILTISSLSVFLVYFFKVGLQQEVQDLSEVATNDHQGQ